MSSTTPPMSGLHAASLSLPVTYHPVLFSQRQELCYTMKNVAYMLGIPIQVYVQLELCHVLPSLSLCHKLGTFFNVPPMSIFNTAQLFFILKATHQKNQAQALKIALKEKKEALFKKIVGQTTLAPINTLSDITRLNSRLQNLYTQMNSLNARIQHINEQLATLNQRIKDPHIVSYPLSSTLPTWHNLQNQQLT